MGATGAAGAIQAYLGIEYTPESLDEGPPEGPDLIRLENMVGCPIPVPANGTTPLPPDAPTSPGPGICVPVPGAAARSLKA